MIMWRCCYVCGGDCVELRPRLVSHRKEECHSLPPRILWFSCTHAPNAWICDPCAAHTVCLIFPCLVLLNFSTLTHILCAAKKDEFFLYLTLAWHQLKRMAFIPNTFSLVHGHGFNTIRFCKQPDTFEQPNTFEVFLRVAWQEKLVKRPEFF